MDLFFNTSIDTTILTNGWFEWLVRNETLNMRCPITILRTDLFTRITLNTPQYYALYVYYIRYICKLSITRLVYH
jgi:hypothetical protein